MYSWEIEKILKENNYCVGGKLLLSLIDIKQNPQINHIKFNPYDNMYEMWDREGNYYHFKAILRSQTKDNDFER